jgi:4-hydroxy-3-polyprenylbenzoate decarboxylase
MSEVSLRSYMDQLEAAGDLCRIGVEVDWDQELAAISRVNLGQAGPALLFENIKGYTDSYCSRVLTCAIGKYSQVAFALDMPGDTPVDQVVAELRRRYRKPVPPAIVTSGPVKDNILLGHDIDLHDLPVPLFHYEDGGRYIDTFSCTVTRDPDSGIPNVGIYRGQILGRDKIGKVIGKIQGWGQHFVKYGLKPEPMPVAIVYGWHEALNLVGGTSFNRNASEYDMAGAILGLPVELVKCETVDLEVPATAELVIEGLIDPDPASFENEGPFGEYHGYQGGMPSPKPVIKVTAITYRDQPVFRAGMEGCRPGFPSEDMGILNTSLAAVLMNSMEDVGILGVTDLWFPPTSSGTHVIVQIDKQHRGHAQQVASALWSRSVSLMAFKHVVVVEQDIDIRDPEAVDWAIAHRVDAGQGGLTTFGPTGGSMLDPGVDPVVRNPAKYGTGRWTRVLVDATRNWDFDPSTAFGGRRFQPVYRLPIGLEQKVCDRWEEYGIDVPYPGSNKREVLTLEKTSKILPEV